MSEGAWYPDPTGRHQLRWWDGARWTAKVHDHGVTLTEDTPDPPKLRSETVPGAPSAPVATEPEAPASSGPTDDRLPNRPTSRGAVILGAIGAVIVVTVLAVLFLRGEDRAGRWSSDDFWEVSGSIDESLGTFLRVPVRMAPGDAIRYRVEPGPALDTVLLVLSGPEPAREVVRAWAVDTAGEVRSDDLDRLLDILRIDGQRLLNAGEARSTFSDRYVLASNGGGFAGRSDSGYLVALAPGEYVVVAQAWSGTGDARLVVEVSRGRFSARDDLATFFGDPWWLPDVDPWFDEWVFFTSGEPYVPGVSGSLQARVAEEYIAGSIEFGSPADAGCVHGLAGRLSDDDAQSLLDGDAAPLTPRAHAVLTEMLDCS